MYKDSFATDNDNPETFFGSFIFWNSAAGKGETKDLSKLLSLIIVLTFLSTN